MNVLRRIAMAIGGTVVVALVIGLVAPKTVHAVANLLVTVTNTPNVNVVNTPSVNVANTSSNPFLISNIEDPGRIAYESTRSGNPSCTASQCTFAFGQVPPNHRLVVENISGEHRINETEVIGVRAVNASLFPLASFLEAPFSLGGFQAFNMPTHFYLDAGDSLTVTVVTPGSLDESNVGLQTITVSGYLLDCSTRPCNPIANF